MVELRWIVCEIQVDSKWNSSVFGLPFLHQSFSYTMQNSAQIIDSGRGNIAKLYVKCEKNCENNVRKYVEILG